MSNSHADTGQQDLRTRTAAIFSIRAFFDFLLDRDIQLTPDLQILGVYLALYDSLVDDDEDVRDHGARVVATVLSADLFTTADRNTNRLSLSPPAAKQRLLLFLYDGYQNSMLLIVESVRRLTGSPSALDSTSAKMQDNEPQTRQGKSILYLRPVADISIEAQTTSTVVFVEERQNLYIDTVSEAEDWADLLIRFDPDSWPLSLVSELEAWTVGGLANIVDLLQTSVDGVLSPTSKPEVFTLFTRVLLAAKVLIMRYEAEASLKERGEEHVCIRLLEKLLDLGRSKHLHDLLLHRIETILVETGLSASETGVVAAAKR